MKRNDLIFICLLFLLAFGLRFYDASYPNFKWGDEVAHVPAATNYLANGQFEPDNWEHPPLRHIIQYVFLQIFGDNPYGWRMRNILFGAVATILTYLFAYEVSGSRKTALVAGILLATDPLHIVLSRYTFDEIYGSTFFLAAALLYLKHNQRSAWLMLSAFFMGCALAVKWYYAPCWMLIYCLALYQHRNYRNIKTTIFITTTYILIPCSVFISSYYFWFGRGYTLHEFIEFITNAYYSLQTYRPETYNPDMLFISHISSLEWFTRSITVGQGTYLDSNRGEFIIYMNSLPIWILTLPSMITLAILSVRKRSLELAMPLLLFCASYTLFVFVKRPVFIYTASTLLPFAFTAIAIAIQKMADRYSAKTYYVLLAVMVGWNLYLYPLVTAKKIALAPYRYLLNNSEVKI